MLAGFSIGRDFYGIVLFGERASFVLCFAFAFFTLLFSSLSSFGQREGPSFIGDGVNLSGDKFVVACLPVFVSQGHGNVCGGQGIYGLAGTKCASLVLLLEIFP